ncbi:MAG: regulatory protein RecX [Clostridia bacterium]|nr:regulatory protein RecX [Clostridia bacterium]
MIVVSVTPAKGHVYCVTLEDGQQASIDKTVWDESPYRKDKDITQDAWETLFDHSQQHRARERALYYLSFRDYGSGEMIKKLVHAGFSGERAAAVVERLQEVGLIDDRRYATILATDMTERKLYPRRRVEMALHEKGFSSEIIAEVVAGLPDKEAEQALELLYKRRYNGNRDEKARKKALGMLARYGFSYTASRKALELWEQDQSNG